jgi:beta-lactamase regulating signal transducer with metallopeptidase domain
MLGWLAHTTVTAAILAGVVALVCRLGRFRPAVRHALWLLVLVKMMVPPVVAWQVPLPDWGRLFRSAAWPAISPSVAVPHERQLEGPTSFVLVPPGAPGEIAAPPTRPQSVDRPVPSGSQPTQGHSTSERTGAGTTDRLWNPASIGTWLGDLWLASVAVVALVVLLRIERFRRLLCWGHLAPRELAQQIHDLAARMRLRPPSSLLLPGLATPCLWCWGKPKLLLPAALMDRFSPECRRGVLAHELAHLRRRDHWVAWLQLAATCLWWWNPLFWLVRRQVRENAELACDAWVVYTLPDCRRAYAEALLEVCRLSARGAAPVPALGMGSRHRRTLERRLTMIMQGPGSCRVHLLGVLAVGLLALIVLPGWSDGQKAEDGRTTEPAKAASERDLEAALKAAQVNGKYEMLLRQIRVPDDVNNYSEFNDYGHYQGTSYAGQNDLPPGYWVYVAPYWYIWRDLSATPKVKRAWGPEQATGTPDTDRAGDLQTAWASRTPDGQDEWLLLEYAELMVPREVQVCETYNPGALYRVTVFRLDGTEVEVWRGKDPTPVGSGRGISKIPVKVSFKTNRVKIYLASKDVPGWNEIDAVGVVDTAGKTHWARSADASSTYAEMMSPRPYVTMRAQTKRPWGPEQVTGPPDTPEAGDFGTAWASLTEDGQDEWVQTEYAEEVFPKEVHVYETYNPGALYKVSVFKPDGTEVEVWKGKDPTPIGSGKGISVIPIKVNFKTKRVKIYLASKDVPGWNEIDAIGLKDTTNRIQWAVSATASSTYAQNQPVSPVDILAEQQAVIQQRLAQLEAENRELKIKNQQLMRMLEEKEKKKAQQKQDK